MNVREYLLAQEDVAFEWGVSDCVQLAARWIEHVSGDNPAASFPYATEIEAKVIISEHGDIETLVTSTLGQDPQRDFRNCHEGDVVMTTFRPFGQLIGLAVPPRAWFRTIGGAVIPMSLELCLAFWRPSCRS